jgi:hypothetical protein
MDGSLKEDGKTPSSFDYNVERDPQGRRDGAQGGVTVEGELGCLGNLETGDAGEEDGIGAEGKLDHSQMLTDPEEAAPSSRPPSSTRWPLPSAPATAPTSSAVRPPATSWRSAASRKSTRASPTPTS